MFQQTPGRNGARRVFILHVDSQATVNEAFILSAAQQLKNLGVQIIPVVYEPFGPNQNLWSQVSSIGGVSPADSYISFNNYAQFGSLIGRIHNYACGKCFLQT